VEESYGGKSKMAKNAEGKEVTVDAESDDEEKKEE
jgi:hypothetical protein